MTTPRVALVTPASLRRRNGDSLRPLAQARGLWACGFRDFVVFTPEPDPALPWPQRPIAARGPFRFILDQPQDFPLIHAHQNAGLFLKGRVWADLHGFAPLEAGLNWRAHPLSARAAAFAVFSRWATRRLARRSERLICAADSIAERVRQAQPQARSVEVIRNCLDPRQFEPSPCPELAVGVIGAFTGRWGASLFKMARETAALCPEAPFRIVGRMEAGQREALAQLQNVEILGELDEAAYKRFFREVSVSLIAFEEWCRGGGSRQKLLQSASAGLAVVATPAGLEGFNAPPETLIGRTPAELAERIKTTLARPEERRRRGLALRESVERNHDYLVEGQRLAELYESALNTPERKCVDILSNR